MMSEEFYVVHYHEGKTLFFDGIGSMIFDRREAFRYNYAQAGRIIYLLIEQSKLKGCEKKYKRIPRRRPQSDDSALNNVTVQPIDELDT